MVDFEEPLLGILNAKVDDSFHDSFSKTSNQRFNRSSEDGAGRGTTGATGCPFLGSWIGKVQDLRVGSTRIGPFIHRAVGARQVHLNLNWPSTIMRKPSAIDSALLLLVSSSSMAVASVELVDK